MHFFRFTALVKVRKCNVTGTFESYFRWESKSMFDTRRIVKDRACGDDCEYVCIEATSLV